MFNLFDVLSQFTYFKKPIKLRSQSEMMKEEQLINSKAVYFLIKTLESKAKNYTDIKLKVQSSIRINK